MYFIYGREGGIVIWNVQTGHDHIDACSCTHTHTHTRKPTLAYTNKWRPVGRPKMCFGLGKAKRKMRVLCDTYVSICARVYVRVCLCSCQCVCIVCTCVCVCASPPPPPPHHHHHHTTPHHTITTTNITKDNGNNQPLLILLHYLEGTCILQIRVITTYADLNT